LGSHAFNVSAILAIFSVKRHIRIIRLNTPQNATEADVVRESGIVVCLMDTGDFAFFGHFSGFLQNGGFPTQLPFIFTWTFGPFV
jgi:hypothetical protein